MLFESTGPGDHCSRPARLLILLLVLGVGLGSGLPGPLTRLRPSGPLWPVCGWERRSRRPSVPIASRYLDRSRYQTRSGDTFWSIARRYSLSPGRLMQANPDFIPERLPIGVYLHLPPEAEQARPAQSTWRWPIGGRITSRYGWRWGRMHKGIDLAAPPGTLVRAADQGQVTFAGWRSGYGLYVVLSHPGGWRTAYGHNSCVFVRMGQRVPAGAALARIGATGNATGIHLHFEVIGPGGYVDPLRVLK